MARHIDTELLIQAPPARVWDVLLDFRAYPQWNPFIVSLQGEAQPGARLEVSIRLQDGARHRFRPVLLQVTPPRRLRWLGRVGVSGVFDGEHDFQLEPEGAGTRLYQRETFQGFLVPLLWRKLEPATRAGFEAMNAALKTRAEAHSPQT